MSGAQATSAIDKLSMAMPGDVAKTMWMGVTAPTGGGAGLFRSGRYLPEGTSVVRNEIRQTRGGPELGAAEQGHQADGVGANLVGRVKKVGAKRIETAAGRCAVPRP